MTSISPILDVFSTTVGRTGIRNTRTKKETSASNNGVRKSTNHSRIHLAKRNESDNRLEEGNLGVEKMETLNTEETIE